MVGEKFACVKIIGRADFASSVDFKRLVDELLQKGYTYFVLDLSECVLMDSTFLGVLAGFGLKMAPPQASGDTSPIELYRPSARITEVLSARRRLPGLASRHIRPSWRSTPRMSPGSKRSLRSWRKT